ncbi:uncharacterized protein LOC110462061 [Mizuhopecten yessoensis]|uniref:uncharacterized protein LOC110462061 n=1 Tax=Mizuhopecten yessoensis TaxID=6573 RepID=UPI000B458B8F|nr:uncharacterized protein LOC110462061 [Mizuhopecten yessoensis]XP_021371521.1 uncharacterized protein LOC110462061 [Mizuhopecten yessoensis]
MAGHTLSSRDSRGANNGSRRNHVGSHQRAGFKDTDPASTHQSLHTRHSDGPRYQTRGVSKLSGGSSTLTKLGRGMFSKKSPRRGEFPEAKEPPLKLPSIQSTSENKALKFNNKKQTSIGSRQDKGGHILLSDDDLDGPPARAHHSSHTDISRNHLNESYDRHGMIYLGPLASHSKIPIDNQDGTGRIDLGPHARAQHSSHTHMSRQSSYQSGGISKLGKSTSQNHRVVYPNPTSRPVDSKPDRRGQLLSREVVLEARFDGTGSKLTDSNRPTLSNNTRQLRAHQAAHTSNSTQGFKPVQGAINAGTGITPIVAGEQSFPDNMHHLIGHQAAHTSNSMQGFKPVQGAINAGTGITPIVGGEPSFPDNMHHLIGHQAAHTSNSTQGFKPVQGAINAGTGITPIVGGEPSFPDNMHHLIGHQAAHTSNSTQGFKPVQGAINAGTGITPIVGGEPSFPDNMHHLIGHQAAHTSNSTQGFKPVQGAINAGTGITPIVGGEPSFPDNMHHLIGHQAAHTSNSTQGFKPVQGAINAGTGITPIVGGEPSFPDNMHHLIGHQAAHTSNSTQGFKPVQGAINAGTGITPIDASEPSFSDDMQFLFGHQAAHTSNSTQGFKPIKTHMALS